MSVVPPTSLVTLSLTSPQVNMQMNKHDFSAALQLFPRSGGLYHQLLQLLESSLGNNRTSARRVRPRCSYIYCLCRIAGTEPEYNTATNWTQNWTGRGESYTEGFEVLEIWMKFTFTHSAADDNLLVHRTRLDSGIHSGLKI